MLNISQADALDGYIGIAANATVFVKMSPIPGLEPHKMVRTWSKSESLMLLSNFVLKELT